MIRRTIVGLVESEVDGASLRILVRRVWEGAPQLALPQVRVFTIPRGRIVQEQPFKRALELARRKFAASAALVVFDVDDDPPDVLESRLRRWAEEACGDFTVGVALANREFENWFIAGIESLQGQCGLGSRLVVPAEPERIRGAKEWLTRARVDGRQYSPPVEQASLMERLDLDLARSRSGSFDKCLREIERILGQSGVVS